MIQEVASGSVGVDSEGNELEVFTEKSFKDDRNIYRVMQKVTDLVSLFLRQHGGMSNGYDTYINGRISHATGGRLEWCTPAKLDVTLKEIRITGAELYSIIYNMVGEYFFVRHEIVLSSEHIEHGCFAVFVTIETKARMNL